MVEFRFDLRPLFTQPIVKVTSNLLPHTFRGDRRQCLDATSKMSEIIDRLGQLSASAQKLSKAVTTAQRLRMSENQTIYLLADVNAGKNGCVIGLLKVGTKDLYLFDETGQTRKVENAPSILDFYIHESRQRAGLGKDLFETMLADEKWTPVKCSVDRPSEKLLGFLKKHYGLVNTIPQANNFVLYEGFFDDGNKQLQLQQQKQQHTNGGMHITNSPNTQLFGATYLGDENNKKRLQRQLDAPNLAAQITQISPVGRYGARRPTCSMAEKKVSEVSLTPSQAAEHAKLNGLKHPLDALSKPSKQLIVERRSSFKDNNASQNQMPNLPGSGQHSIPPSEGFIANQGTPQAQQHNYQHPLTNVVPQPHHQHFATNPNVQQHQPLTPNLTPAQMQRQTQPINPTQQQQQNQQAMYVGNHIPVSMQQQQELYQQKQQQQVPLNQNPSTHGTVNQNCGQPPSNNKTNSNAEPEMCTTCPNCQTTIYLVRGTDQEDVAQQQQLSADGTVPLAASGPA